MYIFAYEPLVREIASRERSDLQMLCYTGRE